MNRNTLELSGLAAVDDSVASQESFETWLKHAAESAAPSSLARRAPLCAGSTLARGRLRVIRRLGEGGMGAVYEAFDVERGEKVALKTLWRLDALGIYTLKNEFRALADVHHANLVGLHELFAEEALWFFTMDLVEGMRFDEWVRPEDKLDEARLRHGLPQLVTGMLAIHQAGKLHRDLKPSNALVTTEGRVVILDFGLVAASALGGVGQTVSDEAVSGTPAYMAPEQAAGRQPSEASDFYALGVMLFEALAGHLPFEGSAGEILAAKQTRAAMAPGCVTPTSSNDLVQLCMALLEQDALRRPSADELRARFRPTLESVPSSWPPFKPKVVSPDLVGRDAELTRLCDAYRASCEGDKPVVVLMSGESGIGKSALVDRFLGPLCAQGHAVVLAGRCYERESVPYKALDPVVDALTRHLRRLPSEEAALLMPRDTWALRRLFPVLGRIAAIAACPEQAIEDSVEVRRRGFQALGELLGRIRDRQPLVIAIDDLQWSDGDSTTLLMHLVRQRDAPKLLLVVSHRSEGMHESAVLRPLHEMLPGDIRLDVRPLQVGPLPDEFAGLLVSGRSGDTARELIRDAGGNPFLLGETVRAGSASHGLSLAEIIRARVAQHSDPERRLLEVVAVAGRPIALQLAAEAAGTPAPTRAAAEMLASAQLLRSGALPGSLECYHDRIRESVVAGLSEQDYRAHHRALGQMLAKTPASDAVHICEHFDRAGDADLAAQYAALAADRAMRASAFGQAARLYGRALQASSVGACERHRLQVALADALAGDGHGRAAAEAYLRSCAGASQAEIVELKRKATRQYLKSGRLALGRELLAEALRPFGMRLPSSPARAIATLVFERTRFRIRPPNLSVSEPTATRHEELQALHRVISGLSSLDALCCASLNAVVLRRALDAGDARIAVQALLVEIWSRTLGIGSTRRVPELIHRAQSLLSVRPDAVLSALLQLHLGLYEYLARIDGDMTKALALIEGFLQTAQGEPLLSYEIALAQYHRINVLAWMGRCTELGRELPAILDDTWQRNDLNLIPLFMGPALVGLLAIGAEAEAERALKRAAMAWSELGNPYAYQDLFLRWGAVSLDHYRGDVRGAWTRCIADDQRFRASSVRHSRSLAGLSYFIRGTSAAALAPMTQSAERDALLREAEQAPLRALSSSHVHPWLLLPKAAGACARGDREVAIQLLRRLDSGRRSANFGPIHAHAARRHLGVLLGGTEGESIVAAADAFFRAGGVVDPERMASTLVPGCTIAKHPLNAR